GCLMTVTATNDTVLDELAAALHQVRAGDFKVRLPRRTGREGVVIDAFNDVVAQQERQVLDLARISRLVGREGKLTERLGDEGLEGSWASGVRTVNALIDDLGRPTTEIARVLAAVAE